VGQVTVSWAAVSGATSYKVYRSTTQGVRGTLIGSTSSTSLADSTVVENTTYYFVVTASNVAGEGAASAAVSVTHTTTWSSAKIGGGGYVRPRLPSGVREPPVRTHRRRRRLPLE
jgi:fibronectin type 3 domain-containing protein